MNINKFHRVIFFAGVCISLTYAGLPIDNPSTAYSASASWASSLPWTIAVDAAAFGVATGNSGAANDVALGNAIADAVGKGGAVVCLGVGTYKFDQEIRLPSKVILRGAGAGCTNARTTDPQTIIEFPMLVGTSATSGQFRIYSNGESNLGVVNIWVNNGAVNLNPAFLANGTATTAGTGAPRDWYSQRKPVMGQNVVILGCKITNAYTMETQGTWQWNWRFTTAIAAYGSNVLVAQCNVAKRTATNSISVAFTGGQANFSGTMAYPFDCRYGIDVNCVQMGGYRGTLSIPFTPAAYPQQFCTGVVIADNTVWCNGRVAISVGGGDGMDENTNGPRGTGPQVLNNHMETEGGICYSVDGKTGTGNSATNENRGIDKVGYGLHIAGNYILVRQQSFVSGPYMTVDGEGILQQGVSGTGVMRNLIEGNTSEGSAGALFIGYNCHFGKYTTLRDNIVQSGEMIGFKLGSVMLQSAVYGNCASNNVPAATNLGAEDCGNGTTSTLSWSAGPVQKKTYEYRVSMSNRTPQGPELRYSLIGKKGTPSSRTVVGCCQPVVVVKSITPEKPR